MWLGLVISIACVCACNPSTSEPTIGTSAEAIIGGQAPSNPTAVVWIAHRDLSRVCSGALVAPRLVVTAKHCAFWPDPTSAPLAADGFRVGFGTSIAALEERTVSALHWIGEPGSLSVADAAATGEDVAVLVLSSPAPAPTTPIAVRFDYAPAATDELALLGFGLSSIQTGQTGTSSLTTTRSLPTCSGAVCVTWTCASRLPWGVRARRCAR